MPTPTYTALSTITLSTAATSVNFTSLDTIAAGYRDLVLVAKVPSASTMQPNITFNNDTGSNYAYNFTASSGLNFRTEASTSANFIKLYNDYEPVAGGLYNLEFSLFDFSQTDRRKNLVFNYGNVRASTYDNVAKGAGVWRSTSAITSIRFSSGTNSFAINSVFSLFGIEA
jgi:hypothetical protein